MRITYLELELPVFNTSTFKVMLPKTVGGILKKESKIV